MHIYHYLTIYMETQWLCPRIGHSGYDYDYVKRSGGEDSRMCLFRV